MFYHIYKYVYSGGPKIYSLCNLSIYSCLPRAMLKVAFERLKTNFMSHILLPHIVCLLVCLCISQKHLGK